MITCLSTEAATPWGKGEHHRMRKAQCDVDLLALDLGAIADAVDFKHAAKALADTLGHIGDQLSRQPMQSPNLTLLALPLDSNDIDLQLLH